MSDMVMTSEGITLLEIVTREEPYPGMDPLFVATKVAGGMIPDFPEKISIPFEALLAGCFKQEPSERWTFAQIVKQTQELRKIFH